MSIIKEVLESAGAEFEKNEAGDSSLKNNNENSDSSEKKEEGGEKQESKEGNPPAEKKEGDESGEKKEEGQEKKDTDPENKTEEKKEEAPAAQKKAIEVYNELNQKFQEENGYDFAQALAIAETDYENMSVNQAITEALILADPDISDEEIDVILEKFEVLDKTEDEIQQMIDDEKITESQLKSLVAERNKLERESRAKLMAFADEVKSKMEASDLPQEKQEPGTQKETNESGNAEQYAKDLAQAIAAKLPEFSKETYEIKDKDGNVIDTVTIDHNDEDRKLISDIMEGKASVFSLWLDKDGKLDERKMMEDIYNSRERGKVATILYNQGFSKGQAEAVKKQSNIDFSKTDQPGESKDEMDPALAEQMKRLGGNYYK